MDPTSERFDASRNPVEIAVRVLRERKEPMAIRELLEAVQRERGGSDAPDPRVLSEIHTLLSLDHRLVIANPGQFGLKEWVPRPKPVRTVTRTTALTGRHRESAESAEDEVEADTEEKEWE